MGHLERPSVAHRPLLVELQRKPSFPPPRLAALSSTLVRRDTVALLKTDQDTKPQRQPWLAGR